MAANGDTVSCSHPKAIGVTLFDSGPAPNVPRDTRECRLRDLVDDLVDQRNRDLIKAESAGACLEETNGSPMRVGDGQSKS